MLKRSRRSTSSKRADILQGTLDMLILRVLSDGSTHGYGIANRIQHSSEDLLKVEEGSLYPALYRLEEQGWIASEWGASENNRKAKFYSLTRDGRKQLAAEAVSWSRLCDAISKVMNVAEKGA
jgi:PadR family transcriptional regulator, regulatory protein PadR